MSLPKDAFIMSDIMETAWQPVLRHVPSTGRGNGVIA